MRTGQIPGLDSSPAEIVVPGGTFDTWMLAAAAIGTTASKSVPITIDTVQYYDRIIGATDDPDAVPPLVTWAPELSTTLDGERFEFRLQRIPLHPFRGVPWMRHLARWHDHDMESS